MLRPCPFPEERPPLSVVPRRCLVKAAVLRRFGDPTALELAEVPDPVPAEDQMVVAVSACGVCGHDRLALQGKLGTPLPVVLGHEIAGTVTEVGGAISGFRVGDRVALVQREPCGRCDLCADGVVNLCRSGRGFYGEDRPGGYAEYILAGEGNAVHLPDTVPDRAGSVLSCAIGTGWHALRRVGARAGEVAVVTAAHGGVGSHALQLCRHLGLRTVAVTSSSGHEQDLLDLGADHVVHLTPDGEPLREQVRRWTGGRLADVVLEVAGPPTFRQSIEALAPRGRLALIGNVDPRDVSLSPGLAILKELSVLGCAHGTREDLEQVVGLVAAGHIRPLVDEEIPLSEAPRAFTEPGRGGPGRRVLVPSL
jgi:acryloyl-coenzyme A reductase